MPLDPHKILNWPFPEIEHTYSEKDTMLYALGLGCGSDPGAVGDLKYVYERGLMALPTMAVVLASPGNWLESEASTADYSKVLHGEQYLSVHRPIPAAGTVIGRTRVKELLDKGKDKGAVLFVERQILDKARGEAIATMTSAAMLDRKSTRLNSSHLGISYAVFCLKKKTQELPHLVHLEEPRPAVAVQREVEAHEHEPQPLQHVPARAGQLARHRRARHAAAHTTA